MIADRHSQERISFRMLLTSEPLSCTMPSSSVCHENPLHVIMGVCMPTSTTAIPGPCYLSRQKHDAPHSLSLTETAVLLRRLSGWDPPGGFVRRTRGLETMSYFLQFLEAATHSSGLFRTRVASVEAFILRLSRIRDFVLKHRFLHLPETQTPSPGTWRGGAAPMN